MNLIGEHSDARVLINASERDFYVDISDCTQTIQLYNRFTNKSEKKNALHKLDVLTKNLLELIDFVSSQKIQTDYNINKAFSTFDKAFAYLESKGYQQQINDDEPFFFSKMICGESFVAKIKENPAAKRLKFRVFIEE